MADISKIQLPNGTAYNIKDDKALPLTGGSVTGPVSFGDSVSIDEATVGDLVVNGSASFINNIQANTINGVTVGSNPKFTDTNTITTATTTGSGNAVTAIAASNGALTITKGITFLTSHQDISGKADKATTLAGYGITDAKIASGVITLGSNTITPLTSSSTLNAAKLSGAIPSAVTATTQASTDNSTKIATTAYVTTAIANLPEPMVFKGSVGTGGTITSLPTAAASNEGHTYKVITALSSPSAKVGDTVISNGSEWIVIPSGDEPSGTVTSIGISNGGGLSVSGSPVTSSGTITISHADTSSQASSSNSGRTYIQSITLDTYGHVTGISTATETVTNTNTWRKVQLNGTDKLGTAISTNPLNLKAGTNMSITESSGTFTFAATDTNTHRPIQMNGTQILGDNTTALNLKAGTGITLANSSGTVTITNSSTNTDTKVTTEAITSGTKYYPILATGVNTAIRQIDNDGFDYYGVSGSGGDASSGGQSRLSLGNSKTLGSGWKKGILRLYGFTTSYYSDLVSGSPTAARTLTLPDNSGTIALISDIPTVPSNIVNTITTTAGAHTAITSQKGNVSFNVPTTAAHVGAAASSHAHGNITSSGDITATAPTIASGDQLIINDSSASKITNGPTFDGSTTAKALTKKGTFEDFQAPLVSGTNIKTINNTSLLGSGNIDRAVNSNSAFYRKYESSYVTSTVPVSTIPVGITNFSSADMLFVDINGLDLVQNVDYTISGTNIVLTTPITLAGQTVHFIALRVVSLTASDYSALKGDPGDVSDVRVDNTSVVTNGIAEIDTSSFLSSFLDFFYPVGTIYETTKSVDEFNPNTAWGGTWERIIGRMLFGAYDEGELTDALAANTNELFSPTTITGSSRTSTAQWAIPLGDKGGSYVHKLSGYQSGTSVHGHGNTLGVSGNGAHSHEPSDTSYSFLASNGTNISVNQTKRSFTSSNSSGHCFVYSDNASAVINEYTTTNSVGHSHTISGSVSNSSVADAQNAHTNMSPYLAVNIWKRTA